MSDFVRDQIIKKAKGLVKGFNKEGGEGCKYAVVNYDNYFRLFVCRCLVVIICLLLIQSGEKMTDAHLLH